MKKQLSALQRDHEALSAEHARSQGTVFELRGHLSKLDEKLAEELEKEEALAKTLAEEKRKEVELEKMLQKVCVCM